MEKKRTIDEFCAEIKLYNFLSRNGGGEIYENLQKALKLDDIQMSSPYFLGMEHALNYIGMYKIKVHEEVEFPTMEG